MKERRWLKPERIAEIEFRRWIAGNHLCHSRFVALRDDNKPRGHSCTDVSFMTHCGPGEKLTRWRKSNDLFVGGGDGGIEFLLAGFFLLVEFPKDLVLGPRGARVSKVDISSKVGQVTP